MAAILRGDVPGVDKDIYLSPTHIRYWWLKGQRTRYRVSDDSWVNLENALRQDPKVCGLQFNLEPRKHMMWFIHDHFKVDLKDVTEIFIDATYNTAKDNIHLYSIVGEETGYGVPLGFMIVEVRKRENTQQVAGMREMLQCNKSFYLQAKALGLYPRFVHTDKDWSELSASTV
jgi:hypothetical protein